MMSKITQHRLQTGCKETERCQTNERRLCEVRIGSRIVLWQNSEKFNNFAYDSHQVSNLSNSLSICGTPTKCSGGASDKGGTPN